jgi:hypothetical protein
MARHPAWFDRIDTILAVVRQSPLEWLGRNELAAIFEVSERDSIRLLHKFGAIERDDVLTLSHSSLAAQLEAIRGGGAYAAFLGQRQEVARELNAARAQDQARRFRVRAAAPSEPLIRLEDLPSTITWRRSAAAGPGRFEIRYSDGADLLWQLAEFLRAAGVNRTEYIEGTEPGES